MKIYVNRKAVRGPWGGENSFMGSVCRYLTRFGHRITIDPNDADIEFAFTNALTNLDIDIVQGLAARGVPIIHRKTGFTCRGSVELRSIVDGVVEGDRRQIAFSPYIQHSIFQSTYSRDLFVEQGFSGSSEIIHNGVDEAVFNQFDAGSLLPAAGSLLPGARPRRTFWDGETRFEVLMCSWSSDPSKGFGDMVEIDAIAAEMPDVGFTFVGNLPKGLTFQRIRTLSPLSHRQLAAKYRSSHALLFLGRHESCSNTIIEAINCGLPVIYHPNSANPEVAGPFGVPYEGGIQQSVQEIKNRYRELVTKLVENPYRIEIAGARYLRAIERVAAGLTP